MTDTPPRLIPVESLRDPRLAPYANLKDRDLERGRLSGADAADGHAGGLFIAEGALVVRQLVASRFRTRSLLVTPTRLAAVRDAIDALPPEIPVFLAPQDLMNQIVGFDMHRGVLAVGERGEPTPASWLRSRCRVVLAAEGMSNHDNVGGLFRTLAGLAGIDAAGVLLDPSACDPLYRKSVRVSMGQALRVPFAVAPKWPDELHAFRAEGFRVVALTLAPGSVSLSAAGRTPPGGKLLLLVGAEGPGLSPGAQAGADLRVTIPMRGGVDSLNVVVAAAIALAALIPADPDDPAHGPANNPS